MQCHYMHLAAIRQKTHGLLRGLVFTLVWTVVRSLLEISMMKMCNVQNVFGAIVCDPPYGVRAGGTKLDYKPRTNGLDPVEHIPSTSPYPLSECLWDLLDTAARLLMPGARLVYFLPSIPNLYQVQSHLNTKAGMLVIQPDLTS